MGKNPSLIGQMGEQLAVNYLLKNGYEILARNYRTPSGELDIVSYRDQWLVFVEVKTRTNVSFGWPDEAVDSRKENAWISSVEEYIETQDWQGEHRMDIIAIWLRPDTSLRQLRHFEDVA